MREYAFGIIISLFFFVSLWATLSDYGVHEDNLIHFMRGQYFLHKLTTGKTQFDLPAGGGPSPLFYIPGQRISLYKPNPPEEAVSLRPFGKQIKELKRNTSSKTSFYDPSSRASLYELSSRTSFYKHNAWGANVFEVPMQGHPAVSDTLMAITNSIFYEKLGVVDDIEAYYLYVVAVSALAVFFIYFFTQKVFGTTAAVFASVSLALFPLYFAESHFNTKDTVQMGFFSIALISLYFFVTKKRSRRWFISFVLSAFLALGTKWNIAFLPFIFLPWLWLVRKKEAVGELLSSRWFFIYGVLAVVLPFLLLIIAWPYLWTHTWAKFIDTFDFYIHVGLLDPRVDTLPSFNLPLGFNLTPLLRVFTMTPPFMLLLFALGIFAIVTRRRAGEWKEQWLVLLWFLVPLARTSRELADTAGSIRHFIEYLPAFVVIAGVGAAFGIEKLSFRFPRIRKNYITRGLLSIYLLFLTFTIFRVHPNENIYFNFLVGGMPGAWKTGLYSWKASYDNVYRQGAVWLDKNAPQNAQLAYLEGTMLAISPLWLRDDLYFGSYFSGFQQKGEYIISLVYPRPPAIFAYNYLERFLEPVHEVTLDGVAVLKIWKNSDAYVKQSMREEKDLEGPFSIAKVNVEKGRAWELSLTQSSRKITRVTFLLPKECLGKRGGVWSLYNQGKEKFMVPGEQITQEGKVEIDFPAEPAEKIRFWDIEGDSCFYQATVEDILYIP